MEGADFRGALEGTYLGPVDGADFRAALAATCILGAFLTGSLHIVRAMMMRICLEI